jgi:hypothetical protein
MANFQKGEQMKKLKSKIYKMLIPSKIFAQKEKKFWQNRRPEDDNEHLMAYWEQRDASPNRIALVNIINNLHPKSILEFGSYCGPNLDMIQRHRHEGKIDLYAVEPNVSACKFLSEHITDVKVFNMTDSEFTASLEVPNRLDLIFANAVFYVLDSQHARKVIEKMAQMANIIVIGDEMDNMNGRRSIFSRKNLSFHHPYQTWLRKCGFDQFDYHDAPVKGRATNGFIVARKRHTVSSPKP